jgi:chromosome partitioning protein
MRTIALLSQKGGTGKTTLCIHLAVSYHQQGMNVLVLDLDPQSSAAEWHDARTDKLPHVEAIQPSRLAKTFTHAKEIGTDILILDTAPHSEGTTLEAARLADIVLIPCQPSIMDLRAMTKTIDLMKLVKVPSFAVLNGVQHHSLGAATEAEKTITRILGLPVCPVRVGERVAYNRCLITGQAAQELEPEGKAASEIRRLAKWIDEQMKVPA